MSKRAFQIVFFVVVNLVFGFTILGYLKNRVSDPEKYLTRIQEYPSGVVYRTEPIHIVFARDFDAKAYPINELISDEIITFSPKIKGHFYWLDARTLEFQPLTPLPFNKEIKAKVNLNKVFIDDDPIWKFKFKFKTVPLTLQVTNLQVHYPPIDSIQSLTIRGQLAFSDFIEIQQVSSHLKAYINDKMVHVDVNYGINQKTYNIIIKQVNRTESEQKLKIEWDFEQYNYKGNILVPIFSQNQFGFCYKTMNYQTPKPEAIINLTDPIDLNLPLGAYIKSEPSDSFQYEVINNNLIIKPIQINQNEYRFTIRKALTSIKGQQLMAEIVQDIDFSPLEPKIKMNQVPALLPLSENNSTFDFKAICLKSVDIRVYEIFNDNILQYLQVDNQNNQTELNRVGKLVIEKTYMLENQPDFNPNQWQIYRLNLSELKVRKNGLFQIQLTFNRNNTANACTSNSENSTHNIKNWYNAYYGSITDTLNPCSNGFYGYRKAIQQSVIFTNIGLIASLNSHDSLHVFTHDLKNNAPLSKAKISFYNFQQQLVATALTDDNGHISIDNGSSIYFIKAEHQNDLNFLKINPALQTQSALNMQDQKGMLLMPKNVYRPLDTLFGAFIASPYFPVSKQGKLIIQLTDFNKNLIFIKELNFNSKGLYAFTDVFPPNIATGEAMLTVKTGKQVLSKPLLILPHSPNQIGFRINQIEKKKGQPNQLSIIALRNNLQLVKNTRVNLNLQFAKKKTELEAYQGFHIYDENPYSWSQNYDTAFNESGLLTLPILKNQENFYGQLKLSASLTDVDGIKQSFDTLIDFSQQTDYWAIKTDTNRLELLKLNRYLSVSNENMPATVQLALNGKIIETFRSKIENGHIKVTPVSPLFGTQDLKVIVQLKNHSKAIFRLPYPAKASLKNETIKPLNSPFNEQQKTSNTLIVNKLAKIEVEALEPTRALIMIESLNGLAKYEWIELASGINLYQFMPTMTMAPKIRVSIIEIQTSKPNLDLVKTQELVFDILPDIKPPIPEISMPYDLLSGESTEVIVSEKEQQAMDYYMVFTTGNKSGGIEEQINQYKIIPNLFSSTWETLSKNSASIFKESQFTNDSNFGNTNQTNEPMHYAKMYGPFNLGVGEKGKHTLEVPWFFGKAQLKLIALNRDAKQITTVNQETYISRPLLIEIDAPSTVSPSEEIEIYANIFSEQLTKNEAVFEIVNPKNLFVQTGTIAPLSVSEFKSTFPIRIKFKPSQGKASFKIMVTSGQHTQTKQVNFEVVNFVPHEYKQVWSQINPNENWHTGFTPIGLRGTNFATMAIGHCENFTTSYYLNALDSLWPQSCDQMIANVFPLLFAIDKLAYVNKAEVDNQIVNALNQLKSFQNQNGSFSEWPSLNQTNLWLTNYVGQFMAEAIVKGYKPSPGVYNKWLLFTQRQINIATYTQASDYIDQCYALYSLALANKPDFELMSNMSYLPLPKQAMLYLSLAYATAGKIKLAKPIFEKAQKLTVSNEKDKRLQYSEVISNCLEYAYFLLTDEPEKTGIIRDRFNLEQPQFTRQNYIEASQILAMYYQFNGSENLKLSLNYRLNKGKEITLESDDARFIKAGWPIEFTLPFSIDITNQSESPVNAVVTWYGSADAENYAGKTNSNIVLETQYFDYNYQPILPTNLKSSTPFIMKLIIKPLDAKIKGFAQLKFVLPTCWVFVNDVPNQTPYYKVDRLPQNMKCEWIKLEPGKTNEITYFLRANYKGDFVLPPIQLTGYLSSQFYVSTKPLWVKVQ